MDGKMETTCRIREFNRFYTVLLGLLDRSFLDSGYSVTETRILFELHQHEGCSANELVERLRIDKGYLSRILKRFHSKGLLTREVSRRDARSFVLRLTAQGNAAAEELIAASNEQIGGLLASLDDRECAEICQAMDVITMYLSRQEEDQQ